ncbi:MAG: hypothetical protein IJ457_09495 [Clostridia bacterium]|nr:hypothetical protein [Clostridia bacterium]
MRSFEEWTSDMEKKVETKIKEKRKERNNMKNKYMKLGAVAACLVLVIGAAAVIPYVANRNESANLPETTVAATDPAQTGDAVGGGELKCKVHYLYHNFAGSLIDYVGQDKFDEWLESVSETEDLSEDCPCNANIKNFIDYFDIPYEVFVVKGNLTGHLEYDPEILYFGTEEEIEAHFRDFEKFAKDYIITEHLLKLGFNLEEKYADKLTEYADRTVRFSIPELVVYGGITKDELIKAIDEVSENIYEKFGEVYTFDYDIDGLYPDGVATLYDAYAKDDESVYDRVSRLDALFCGLIE